MAEVWEVDGQLYSYESYYALDEDAWIHEVAADGNTGFLEIVIPDATPDGPFTPQRHKAIMRSHEGVLPISVVTRLIESARSAGDIA